MKRLLLIVFVAAICFVPATSAVAKVEKPLPFWFARPHVHVDKYHDGIIQFYKDIPMHIVLSKYNVRSGRYTVIASGVVMRVGNFKWADRTYAKGDVYYTQVMYCNPVNEIPGRHCYWTPRYGPFTPVNWYWAGWPR